MPYDRVPGPPPHNHVPHTDADGIWSGFKPDPTSLDGTITDVNITTGDPTVQVRGPDGRNWTVELADGPTNARAGLSRTSFLPGEQIRVLGRRTQRFGERRIKALSLTVEGRRFDLFCQPEPA